MANNKVGFDFYSVDTDRYLDIKIKRLKKELGCSVSYCCFVGLFDDNLFSSYKILTSYKIQKQWLKKILVIDFQEFNKLFLIIPEDEIPKYKLNPKSRLYNKNLKLWYNLRRLVFERDKHTCQYCGQVGGDLEADHIIAFSKGGSDELNNLTTSCRKCNRQKKDKSVSDFLKWKENGKAN